MTQLKNNFTIAPSHGTDGDAGNQLKIDQFIFIKNLYFIIISLTEYSQLFLLFYFCCFLFFFTL